MPFLRAWRCRGCEHRFYFPKHPPFAICPKCGNSDLHTVKRNRVPVGLWGRTRFRNLVLRILGGKPYRCEDCRRNFMERRDLRQPSSLKANAS